MRLFPKIAIALFIVTGVILLVIPREQLPTYYDMPYMAFAAFVCALVIFFAPERVRSPIALILFFNATGDLGFYELYRYGFEYDKIIHFITPLVSMLALVPWIGVRKAILVVVGVSFLWELYEYLADALLKTHLFGVYRHQVFRDTVTDLCMNILGITTALLTLRLKKGDHVSR